MRELDRLLGEIRACELCRDHLPAGPRPILRAGAHARILVIGQAPGRRVHASGVPWDDPSGRRLRAWMGIDEATFYDESQIALVPMGFCYPGRGRSGDLPPRPECAATWHRELLAHLPDVRLTLLLSRFALDHYLGRRQKKTLTDTVRAYREYAPSIFPLPHPSPRNNIWLRKNPWFEEEVVPALQVVIASARG